MVGKLWDQVLQNKKAFPEEGHFRLKELLTPKARGCVVYSKDRKLFRGAGDLDPLVRSDKERKTQILTTPSCPLCAALT